MKTTPKQQEDDTMDNLRRRVLDLFQSLERTHPGKVLVEEFMRPLGLTADQLARETGMPAQNINEFIEGNRKFTPAVTAVLERCFGPAVQKLVESQTHHDLGRPNLELLVRLIFLKISCKALECKIALDEMLALLRDPVDEFASQRV